MAFASCFASVFVHAAPAYITPMRAQEALYAGSSWRYDGGRLKIDGKLLIGLSGAPYAFASAQTADTWCRTGRRVIEAERAVVERLDAVVRKTWIANKREKLAARAKAVVVRAMKQPDAAKQAALLEEAAWCEIKWG